MNDSFWRQRCVKEAAKSREVELRAKKDARAARLKDILVLALYFLGSIKEKAQSFEVVRVERWSSATK